MARNVPMIRDGLVSKNGTQNVKVKLKLFKNALFTKYYSGRTNHNTCERFQYQRDVPIVVPKCETCYL